MEINLSNDENKIPEIRETPKNQNWGGVRIAEKIGRGILGFILGAGAGTIAGVAATAFMGPLAMLLGAGLGFLVGGCLGIAIASAGNHEKPTKLFEAVMNNNAKETSARMGTHKTRSSWWLTNI